MDYRLYHAINTFVGHHAWLGRAAGAFESWSIPLFAVATCLLWLLARPNSSSRWKQATIAALGSAALALLANQLLARVWERPRPYTSHLDALVFAARSHDPSFPSDHTAAAFAIAIAIFLYQRRAGTGFLAAAVFVAVGRVVAGLHYPLDITVGALVGALSAVVVTLLARPLVDRVARLLGRVTDPVVSPLWKLANDRRTHRS